MKVGALAEVWARLSDILVYVVFFERVYIILAF